MPSPARPPGPRAVEALAAVQDPGAGRLRDAGAERDLLAQRLVRVKLLALRARERPRRLGEHPRGQVQLADLVQPARFADQLARLAIEPDLDGRRERIARRRVGMAARARDVRLEAVEQRLAAQPGLGRLVEGSRRRSGLGSAPGEGPPLWGCELIEQALQFVVAELAGLRALAAPCLDHDVRAPALLGQRQLEPGAAVARRRATRAARPRCARSPRSRHPRSPTRSAAQRCISSASSTSSQSSGGDLTRVRSTASHPVASFGPAGLRLLPVASRVHRQRLEERAALVLAEDVAHRVADLADRGAVAQRVLDRVEQVAVAARDLAQRLEARSSTSFGVAVGLERGQALELAALGLRVDAQDVDVVDAVGDVLVDPDDDVLARGVALVVGQRRLLDLPLDEVERLDRAAELLDPVDQLPRARLDLVGQALDEVRARERVDGVGGARTRARSPAGCAARSAPSARSAARAPRRSRWCAATGCRRRRRRSPAARRG